MKYDPQKHHRRSIRLKGYDYSQAGAYFVNIVTQARACLFGDVVAGEMRLNDFGQVVHGVWNNLPNHYAGVELDAFVVMPNHVHGIVVIVGAGFKPAPTTTTAPTQHGLPEIIRGFKTFSARRINELRGTPGVPVWQRNYYEHIIRDDESLNRIREYIANNPSQWAADRENPDVVRATYASPRQDEPWRI
ncbi:transposase [Candidatus Roseilinea sp. NK_OTU-006]|jgi:REP element-mobilizing transposase RayT|uniref:transposase n=1 Tax=Candidatus Roseilinea sp. NK_OTU-006 TaxID=2704250 RepID=UPI00145F75A3|nr:transposase [Candidatus Roseilinea sp. NK_OTU-006]